jgi:hypothetical protein
MRIKEIIMLSLVLLVAFSMIGADGCNSSEKTTAGPYLGGTKGITIAFAPEAPPKEVFDAGVYPFDVSIQLTNSGEWEVKKEDTQVRILGIDPADFSKVQADFTQQPFEDLMPSTKEPDTGKSLSGTTSSVDFQGLNYKNAVTGNMPMPLYADVCYLYGTNVISQLCVKKDPTDTSSKICKIEEDKSVYSSGAPVQVTYFHQSIGGKNLLRFTFTVKKVAVSGDVFEKSTKCNTEGILHENKVWVEVNVPEMPGTRCSGLQGGTENAGFVTLYNGERTITCTQPVTAETDYVKNLDMKLVYDYRDQLPQILTIKHTP